MRCSKGYSLGRFQCVRSHRDPPFRRAYRHCHKKAPTTKEDGSMIHFLIEAALSCLFFVLPFVVALRAFRIGNALAHRPLSHLMLERPPAARLLMITGRMRLLLPRSADVTLLEELQARIQAKSSSGSRSRSIAAPITMADPTREPSGPPPDTGSTPPAKELGSSHQ